jgi:sporulation protein YlmC with PRC-barrel domain
MLINSEKLISLKVETESGVYVGRVQSFDIDCDTQSVRSYRVKRSLFEGGMFTEEISVHHKQVELITEEKMVVVDNVVKYKVGDQKVVFVGTTQAEV